MYLKNLILVDAEIDPFDLNQVMWALSVRTRAEDVMVLDNMAMVPIDPAARVQGKGHHLIIDATTPLPPDVGAEAPRIVSPPTGEEIDRLAQKIQQLQAGEGQ